MPSTSMTVTVANGHGSVSLSQFRSVYLTLDHAALVTAKRSRSDGADLFISYTGTAVHREVYVEDGNTASTRVWFSLAQSIAAGANDAGYTLHWGDLTASLPVVAAQAYSQVNRTTASATYRGDDRRSQPFAWFDDFKYTRASGAWVAAVAGDAIDGTQYGTNGSWTYDAGGAAKAPLGSTDQFFKAIGDVARSVQRVRANVTLGSGSGSSCRVGVLTSSNNAVDSSADLDGYGAGLQGNTGDTASLIRWTNGIDSTLDSSSITAQVGLETDIDIEVDGDSATQDATVATDTANLNATDATHSGSYWGVYCDSTSGSGTFYCFRVMSMIWDGVPDTDITVSGTVPSISLPACSAGFPVSETVVYPHAADSFPDFLSPRSAAAVVGGYGERFDIGSFSVQWPFLTPTDYFEILAFYEEKKGSSFSWTPPGGSARTVRIRPGSLSATQETPQRFTLSMSLDKVPL